MLDSRINSICTFSAWGAVSGDCLIISQRSLSLVHNCCLYGFSDKALISSNSFNCYSWPRASRSAKSLFLPSALLLAIKYSTLWAPNNSSSSLKSLGISINLPSQKIHSSQPLFGRPAQPVLKVLLYFEIGVQAALMYRSSNHNIHYTELTRQAKQKRALRGNRRAFHIKYSQYHRQRKCLTFHGRLKDILRPDTSGLRMTCVQV